MSKYYLFLDESGHHGLKTINREFPILLLCGCIFEQNYFNREFTQQVNSLKIKYFQNEQIILHSRDIRKWQRDFKVLGDIQLRHKFYQDLDRLLGQANFTVIASAILKEDLINQYGPRTDNPYNLCLSFILERTIFYLDNQNCEGVELIAEARGKKEDASLQNQYQITLSNGTSYVNNNRFERMFLGFRFTKKRENHIGTQICDLIAYPIANKILYPNKENFAFKVIEPKLYRQFIGEDYLGYGLKIFP